MTELEKAARMALDALRRVQYEAVSLADAQVIALEALTQSLASLPAPQQATPERKGEPVAWMRKTDITELVDFEPETEGWMPLYTSPQVPEDVMLDAERYRWLRDKGRYNDFRVEQKTPGWVTTHSAGSLDAAIDAARKGE